MIVLIIVGIIGIFLILGISGLIYYKTTSSPKETFTSCNKTKCNKFIHDNIIKYDKSFNTNEKTPCEGCYPYFHYAWIPEHGLAVDKGVGWTPCGTKDQCYSSLKY